MKKKLIALAVAGAAVLGLAGCAPTSPDKGLVCEVSEKDHTIQSGTGVYRVYSDCGVFNIEDAPFLLRFNSADLYAHIEPGKTYRFTTYGFRNGFFSWFPNITDAVEVQPG